MVCQYPSSPKCSPYRTRQPELSPGRDYTIIISPILNELHWLPVEKRITFKLLILAYKCNQGVAPQYLLDIVKSYQPARNIRSSSINLLTPYSAITKGYGQRAFQYAIPKLWNSLPNHLRECQSFEQFKTKLKTHLFSS